MDQRTRERLPVLPALTAWVDRERATTAAVLHAARNTTPGELFTAGGLTLRRSVMKTVDHRADLGRTPGHRETARRQLRRAPRVLDLGHGGSVAAHRHSH